MGSDVSITCGSRTAYWSVISNKDEVIDADFDPMNMPLQDSSQVQIMDFGGRRKTITLKGLLIDGVGLGSGGGWESITNNGSKIEQLDTYFFNTSGGSSSLSLSLPGRTAISGIAVWRHRSEAGNVVTKEFMIRFLEGVVWG